MKRTLKGTEPEHLLDYRTRFPHQAWDTMRQDAEHGGRDAFEQCRIAIVDHQGGLCAYCENDIRDLDPLKCRIEHFHSKSDNQSGINWHLKWENLLAVCTGGSSRFSTWPHMLEPIASNLSCDAHKDRLITCGTVEKSCESTLINPLALQALPVLFRIDKSNGQLLPDANACANHPIPIGMNGPLVDIIDHTIMVFNLNCDRLCMARRAVIYDIEKNKKKQRDQGFSFEAGMQNLCEFYFRRRWPGFFTTLYLCLGESAHAHLSRIAYDG